MTCVTFYYLCHEEGACCIALHFFKQMLFTRAHNSSQATKTETETKRHSNDYYLCLVVCLSVGLCKTSGPFAISRITVNNVLNFSVCRFLLSEFECFYSALGHINSVFKE